MVKNWENLNMIKFIIPVVALITSISAFAHATNLACPKFTASLFTNKGTNAPIETPSAGNYYGRVGNHVGDDVVARIYQPVDPGGLIEGINKGTPFCTAGNDFFVGKLAGVKLINSSTSSCTYQFTFDGICDDQGQPGTWTLDVKATDYTAK